ncbi:hypothetical protein SLEP1_g28750 [Rubroshorea leprosula]|uniref:Uncharacterized protein n=1 Tax=Rubroshorea leprosula TaxID=152421 RepID=A0AAV5JUM3_9ROSI|nr:hypothetical protein SLEP1_g28750 [Rubroshorea leprosula]
MIEMKKAWTYGFSNEISTVSTSPNHKGRGPAEQNTKNRNAPASHQALRPAPLSLRPYASTPAPALHQILALLCTEPCAPAAPSLRLDHAQISLLCAPCCVDPAAAPLSLQPTEHETNLQDDITLQLSWLLCRASFGLTRSMVEGKRRKLKGLDEERRRVFRVSMFGYK